MSDVDGEHYGRQDTLGTLAALAPWWEQLAAGRTVPPSFDRLLVAQIEVLAGALGQPVPAPSWDELAAMGTRVTAEVRARRLDPELVLGPSLRLLRAGGEALRAAGSMPPTAVGEVVQVNSSSGGVPKLPRPEAMITSDGVVGDRQGVRRHHGRPWQAVCLWSAEVIHELAAEGHPIGLGSAGENLTLRGLPWDQVQAGVRISIGTAVVECTLFALPCRSNAQWFLGGEFQRMHHDRGPWSRVYARVLTPGRVTPGDPAVLEPPAPTPTPTLA